MEWMILPYKRYADFNGRSRRMEYWMFTLFYVLVTIAFVILMFAGLPWAEINSNSGSSDAPPPLFWIGSIGLMLFMLGSIVPSIAVGVRRFHDQDKSGWMWLINFVPYIGGFIVLVFMCLEGTPGDNQYGPDPMDPDRVDVFS